MVAVRHIIDAAADQAGMTRAVLIEPVGRPACRARQRAMYVARILRPDISAPALARMFGGRHHAIVYRSASRVAERLLAGEPTETSLVTALCSQLERVDAPLQALAREEADLLAKLTDVRARRKDYLEALDRDLNS